MSFGVYAIKVVRRGTVWKLSAMSKSPRGTKFTAKTMSFDAKDLTKAQRQTEVGKVVNLLMPASVVVE